MKFQTLVITALELIICLLWDIRQGTSRKNLGEDFDVVISHLRNFREEGINHDTNRT